MAEQNNISGTLPPVEGRSDVAGDLEEEQRNAYSSHSAGVPPQGKKAASRPQQGQDQRQEAGMLPPVEGRSDVAGDLEEEQRNAYSAHHPGASF
jgi:hypothetical protein